MLKNWGKELKEFILHGNVLDMAVGIIIGASFGKIVDSLVKDIIMPPIGLILGKVDFSNLYLQIYPYGTHYSSLDAAKAAGAVTINYGAFLNNVISFLIVACAVFLIIKSINTLRAAAVILKLFKSPGIIRKKRKRKKRLQQKSALTAIPVFR